MKATAIKIFLVALALCLPSAKAHATGYSITIPSVATYPTTTIRFSAPGVLNGSQTIAAGSIKVSFNGANFAAAPSGGRWITNGSGTYFGFTCAPSSVACMKATRGKGSYTYKLVGPAFAAPASKGEFHLNWDVNPPGDVAQDVSNVPGAQQHRSVPGRDACAGRADSQENDRLRLEPFATCAGGPLFG